jgi:hypothetical protein
MERPNLFILDIWQRHENIVLQTLCEALSVLNLCVTTNNTEDEITIELVKCIRNVVFKKKYVYCGNIVCQANNQPLGGKDESINRLRKKPDIQWGFVNIYADSVEGLERYFTIECKCLSDSGTANAYVKNGIMRFVLSDYGYGQNEKSGAMIGYIKDNSEDELFINVNIQADKYHLSPVMRYEDNEGKAILKLKQEIEDREFLPYNFTLHHYWVSITHKNELNDILKLIAIKKKPSKNWMEMNWDLSTNRG